MSFQERLGKELLLFDGAMGTMLQERGLAAGALPELWNITHSDVVCDIHRAYVQAGCNVLKANTFGANALKLKGAAYTPGEVIAKGVELARKAAGTDALVALDVGPTGKLLKPFGDLEFEKAVALFSEMVIAGAEAGADLVLLETMSDTYEIKAALLAVKENCDLPVVVTFTPDESGRLLTGADILTAVCLIEGLGADALGFNCGLGPVQMKALLPQLLQCTSLPVVVNPNAGMPELVNGKTIFPISPDEFAAEMRKIAAQVQAIGGCCGTTPAHLGAVAKACRGMKPAPVTRKEYTAVSSYGKTVVFGGRTVIVGERINPTGKPRMKQALRENDMDYLYREGLSQMDSGAEILDVNVGIPDIDEAAVLAQVVTGLQGITNAPLQIDTADVVAAERALRAYNGKPLLNSVNGKQESLDAVLPLVKKYGAAVVALTLDEDGIPETAEGRIAIAEKIIAAAEAYGIPKKDIIIDALTMTVSTGGDNAHVTLEAMEHIRRKLGVHTVLGVSNVSFGLPERERINAAFFTLAMNHGLSAGIVNPMNRAMMDAYYTHNVLSGADVDCNEYIERFANQQEGVVKRNPAAEEISLYDAIVSGLREQAGKAAAEMVGKLPPLEIINGYLIPALDKVGKDFENNVLFLPQLLMSAESAKEAFEAIKLHIVKQGEATLKREKIVLATVKGDIHDIGKNIVKVLLENYNFDVIDLGKDVDPTLIVAATIKEKAPLVGLSALMTTTVVHMQETIRLLREQVPGCKVMVGGAVLTQDYADQMNADFYSKDAMGSVRYADQLFQKR